MLFFVLRSSGSLKNTSYWVFRLLRIQSFNVLKFSRLKTSRSTIPFVLFSPEWKPSYLSLNHNTLSRYFFFFVWYGMGLFSPERRSPEWNFCHFRLKQTFSTKYVQYDRFGVLSTYRSSILLFNTVTYESYTTRCFYGSFFPLLFIPLKILNCYVTRPIVSYSLLDRELNSLSNDVQ